MTKTYIIHRIHSARIRSSNIDFQEAGVWVTDDLDSTINIFVPYGNIDQIIEVREAPAKEVDDNTEEGEEK